MRVLIFFLLGHLSLDAQSYMTYLSYVNEAELLIVEKNYQGALRAYDKAFSSWERPLASDYRNALQCAVFSGDAEKGYEHSKELIKLGCDLDFFLKQVNLKPFRASRTWFRIIKEYPALRSQFIKKCNWELRTRIETLNALDQYWRNQDPDYTILKDSVFREDRRIMEEVLQILREGHPSEYDIGVFIVSDTLLQSSSPLHIILLHNYTNHDNYKEGIDLTDMLLSATKAGLMHPDNFSYLNDRSGAYKMQAGFAREGVLWTANGKMYFEKMNPEKREEVDRRRMSLGLCTIEEMRKKAVFQACEPGGVNFFKADFIASADMPPPILKTFFIEIDACFD